MTEEVHKVTTEKQKNPGRQEWGRKLGKMQKLKTQTEEVHENKTSFKWDYVLTFVTVVVGVGALYYQKKSYECQLELHKQKKPVTEKKEARFSDF